MCYQSEECNITAYLHNLLGMLHFKGWIIWGILRKHFGNEKTNTEIVKERKLRCSRKYFQLLLKTKHAAATTKSYMAECFKQITLINILGESCKPIKELAKTIIMQEKDS